MTRIVGEVMTSEAVEARRETPFEDVARRPDRHRIGGVPVVDDDEVLGVVSETDLIRHQAARPPHGRVRRGRESARGSTPDAAVAARATTERRPCRTYG
ncbi:CBS domain-containing protein [Streptomyces sp. NBC_00015]|uniref:CBS domain-containing protein n=1 Tax=Streptomyces sp. NBC_00015 TaxID=2903611 RepID=UPI003864B6A8